MMSVLIRLTSDNSLELMRINALCGRFMMLCLLVR